MYFRKKIWFIFYTILFASALALVALSISKNNAIEARHQSESQSLAKLLSQSFNATLVQNELLLTVVGNRILSNQLYLHPQRAQKLLSQISAIQSNLAGWALIRPDGNFIVTAHNLAKHKKLPNLLQNENTRESFIRALQSDRMVLGQTFYFSPLQKWILPFRKALRDKDGNVVAVLVTEIPIDKGERLLGTNRLPENKHIVFINGSNRHRIFSPAANPGKFHFLYNVPVQGKIFSQIDQILAKDYHATVKDIGLSKSQLDLYIKGKADMLNKDVNAAICFDSRYNVWTLIVQPANMVTRELSHFILSYFVIFFIANLIIFLLFRAIVRSEERNKKQLTYKAEHDSLTGLYSRNYLDGQAFKALTKQKTTAFFVDLDNFKTINDTFGHQLGDKILKKVATRLTEMTDKNDLVFRIGGDEFLVLLFNPKDDQALAEKIIHTISQPYQVDGIPFSIGVSIGIARSDNQKQSMDLLIAQADMAMYAAKKRKNSIECFSADMSDRVKRKLQIEQELRTAIENNEIYLAYQPQIHRNGSFHGVEALARWNNKTLGNVAPDEFIRISETTGLMPELGRFITQLALKEVGELQDRLSKAFNLSINVSPKQLLETRFLEDFKTDIQNSTIPTSCLTMEITESVFIEDIQKLLPLFHEIRKMGISLSLDDFGTGYSSLSLLETLPLNELKVDKTFVDRLLVSSNKQSIASAIIKIAHNVGTFSLAEGVETKEQLDFLLNHECQVIQGYYFSKPLSIAELEDYLVHYTSN